MSLSQRFEALKEESKKKDEILYSLKQAFFGSAAYNHDFSELVDEVQELQEKLSHQKGREENALESLQAENYRLYLLVRFLSGDKEAFKPMIGMDRGDGLDHTVFGKR
jgi:hypothetical protein